MKERKKKKSRFVQEEITGLYILANFSEPLGLELGVIYELASSYLALLQWGVA